MNKLCIIATLTVTMIAAPALALDSPEDQSGHSTVKLFFVTIPQPETSSVSDSKDMARAGGLILPASEIRPASIYLDGEFVGNAMFGLMDVTPKLNLPAGLHKFRIECQGYQTFDAELKVLGAASEQWLVVTMQAAGDRSASPSPEPAQAGKR